MQLRRKQTPAEPEPAASQTPAEAEAARKGRPTPKRKEAEAANRRPLVPAASRGASPTEKQRVRATREREYQALRSGDERFLPVRDKGPQRRWIRDFVDARRSLGEYFLPFAIAILLGTMVLAANATAALVITLLMYGFVLLVIIDEVILTRTLKRSLVAKFGTDSIERGSTLYAVTRSVQIRRVRLPKPKVNRGEYPS